MLRLLDSEGSHARLRLRRCSNPKLMTSCPMSKLLENLGTRSQWEGWDRCEGLGFGWAGDGSGLADMCGATHGAAGLTFEMEWGSLPWIREGFIAEMKSYVRERLGWTCLHRKKCPLPRRFMAQKCRVLANNSLTHTQTIYQELWKNNQKLGMFGQLRNDGR